jgi:hypothetical protein
MGPVTMEVKINRNSQAVLYMPTGEKLHPISGEVLNIQFQLCTCFFYCDNLYLFNITIVVIKFLFLRH